MSMHGKFPNQVAALVRMWGIEKGNEGAKEIVADR